MKRILFILLFFIALCFYHSIALASQGPPSPVCEVEAVILKMNTLNDVDIKITSTGKIIEEGYEPNFDCKTYNNQVFENLSIRPKGDFKKGQEIKGEMSYFIDEFTPDGKWSLNNTVILSEPKENITDKTLAKAKQSNYLYYVIPSLLVIFIIIIYLSFKKKLGN